MQVSGAPWVPCVPFVGPQGQGRRRGLGDRHGRCSSGSHTCYCSHVQVTAAFTLPCRLLRYGMASCLNTDTPQVTIRCC